MDLKSRPASNDLVLPSSSTIPSTPPPAAPSLLPWSDEEEQDCLHCRMAGDSYSEVGAQLIRLQHPLRSVEEIHAKLEELEKGSNHALHAHLKGFGWKGDVVGVKAHLEKRRKKEQSSSSSSSRLESESKPRLRPTKRARISSPQPSSSRTTRTRKRERERETSSSPPPRKIKRERFESESDVEDIPRRKDPIQGHHASPAVSHLLAPASQISSTTTASTAIPPPKTWRSLSKQRELRPVIREQQQQQPLSDSRSIPDNIIAAPPYDKSYTTTSTSTSKSTALTTAAEKEAEDPFNLLLEEYVNDEGAWWQPHPSLFFVGL